MATPKQVTINDVVQGRLFIDPLVDGRLPIRRNYTLTGDDQVLLDAAGTLLMEREPLWADVPQNIKDALIAIDNWTYDQILADRGMT